MKGSTCALARAHPPAATSHRRAAHHAAILTRARQNKSPTCGPTWPRSTHAGQPAAFALRNTVSGVAAAPGSRAPRQGRAARLGARLAAVRPGTRLQGRPAVLAQAASAPRPHFQRSWALSWEGGRQQGPLDATAPTAPGSVLSAACRCRRPAGGCASCAGAGGLSAPERPAATGGLPEAVKAPSPPGPQVERSQRSSGRAGASEDPWMQQLRARLAAASPRSSGLQLWVACRRRCTSGPEPAAAHAPNA